MHSLRLVRYDEAHQQSKAFSHATSNTSARRLGGVGVSAELTSVAANAAAAALHSFYQISRALNLSSMLTMKPRPQNYSLGHSNDGHTFDAPMRISHSIQNEGQPDMTAGG